jgi:predicted amidohydrolase YtcJ
VIDSLSRLVKKASPGQWIQGTIGLTVFNDTSIRRKLLDSISPNNPVALEIMWGHGMIINSKALKAIKITDTDADPLGGWYERTPGTKYITGALYEYAQFPVWQALATTEPAKMVKALQAHAQEELTLGITTVQNMNSLLRGNAAKKIYRVAQLPVRTRIINMPGTTPNGRDMVDWNNNENWSSSLSYISGIKYVIDGTSLEQTELKTKPYPGKTNWYGRLNFPVDSIKQILKEALTSNRQLMLHVVGDSATKIVLELMKQMATPEQWNQKRVRIEHGVGILTAASINDVKSLGIIIVNTPRNTKKCPLRTWVDAGIPVAIGPDGLINPYLNIMFMSAQQTDPNQNISIEQAVIAYTRGSAYAEFAESYKGTLTPGKLADIAVLSQDIFTIPAQQLPATHSVLTIVDGKIVYQQLDSNDK